MSYFGSDFNGHEYADLGLSVAWATCNVGASRPSDYGDYFAWGEIETKSEYTELNSSARYKPPETIAGIPTRDAARASWGGTWRLPNEREIIELVERCRYTVTTQGGHKGHLVTGPNGNSIFLPATGMMAGDSLHDAEDVGWYWSATPFRGVDYGRCFHCRVKLPPYDGYIEHGNRHFGLNGLPFFYGLTIRPVSGIQVDCDLSKIFSFLPPGTYY